MLSVLMYVWYYTAATHFILALANRLASMALIIFISFGSFRTDDINWTRWDFIPNTMVKHIGV